MTNSEGRLIMETNFLVRPRLLGIMKPMMTAGSHIVNISSMGGFQGGSKYKGLSYYSASKAALACLTECLAVEFRDSGISVNCLALGAVQTEMLISISRFIKPLSTQNKWQNIFRTLPLTGISFLTEKYYRWLLVIHDWHAVA